MAGNANDERNFAVEIHVRLLDEGTDCTRPTQGIVLENGLIQLLPTDNYNQGDEHWEFLPGSIVRAKEVRNADGSYLIAAGGSGRFRRTNISGNLTNRELAYQGTS